MTPRGCLYILAKLRKAAHGLSHGTSDEVDIRRGVICLIAYTIELGSEILASRPQRIGGWLLVRTLWHNTGCLAWLLHGPGDIGTRINQLQDDNDIRAQKGLIDEPNLVLGKKGVDDLLRGSDHNREALKEAAGEALSNAKKTGQRGDWGSLYVRDLQKALSKAVLKAVLKAAESLADDDSKKELQKILQYAEIARIRGDDFAHPNPFTVLTRLNLIDDTSFLIRKRGLTEDFIQDSELRITTTSLLLLLQVCAIVAHDRNAISLTKIMRIGARETNSLVT